MRIIIIICCFSILSVKSQSPRLSLFEEFTGENCPPCAATNPGLNLLLRQPVNKSRIVAIKWQVPIPSTPTATWSLYQTNKTEIDWRYQGSPNGYGYQSQWTSTTTPTSGIGAAPSALIDGQHLWQFGAASDHAGAITSSVIATAQSYTSPFSVNIQREWNSTYTAINATINITASANYTATGSLVFRLVMTERHIKFNTPPGSNGEKEFEDVARASFPNLQSGTSLPSGWLNGQSQSFTLSCTVPPHVLNKAEAALVGFIQDDGNRKVVQAALADAQGTLDDAAASAILVPEISCTSVITPTVEVRNHGTNAITSLTLTTLFDNAPSASTTWTGSIAPGTVTLIAMPSVTVSQGQHSYLFNISGVNGNTDTYAGNNSQSTKLITVTNFSGLATAETFTAGVFPPAGWSVMNGDKGIYSWGRSPLVGAFGTNSGASKYDFYNNGAAGDVDDLYMPPLDLTTVATASLFFDIAHAMYPDYPDRLMVQISANCGNTWTTVYDKAGSTLATAAPQTSEYFPAANEWRTEIIDLSGFSVPQALIRFRAVNGNGNLLWLDNVNISNINTVGILERVNAGPLMRIQPNPGTAQVSISLAGAVGESGTISICSQTGKLLRKETFDLKEGQETFILDTHSLPTGMYFIILHTGAYTSTGKLIIAD
jgi:hypothetical protein